MSACFDDLTNFYHKEVQIRQRSGDDPCTLWVDLAPDGAVTLQSVYGRQDLTRSEMARSCSRDCHGAGSSSLGKRGQVCSLVSSEILGESDLVLSRHSLSLLPHSKAVCLLSNLRGMTRVGGKIFISTFGLHSSLGDSYTARYRPLQERFSPVQARKGLESLHNIPICLYSEREFFITLIEAGWAVLRTATSTEGNVLAVGVRL